MKKQIVVYSWSKKSENSQVLDISITLEAYPAKNENTPNQCNSVNVSTMKNFKNNKIERTLK